MKKHVFPQRHILPALFALALVSCNRNAPDASGDAARNAPETGGGTTASATASVAKWTIAPVLDGIRVPAKTFTAKVEGGATAAQTLRVENGTSIEIPAAAFVDAAGAAVSVPVEIRYEEYHTPAEIIASGAPMKVRGKDGTESWMKTAGMFRIEGSAGGKPVFIAPGKPLTVNMASEKGSDCDFWRFDETEGNWVNIGHAAPVPNPEPAQNAAAAGSAKKPKKQSAAAATAARPPLKPNLVDKQKPVLDFDINYDAVPELAEAAGLVWQYAGNDPAQDPAQNPKIAATPWDYAKLERSAEAGVFSMTLSYGSQKITLPVKPCRQPGSFQKAMAEYEKDLALFEKKQAAYAKQSVADELTAATADFVRSFKVENFGVYNWDWLYKEPDAVQLAADFDFGEDISPELKRAVTICLITADGRTVIAYPFEDWRRFSFIPKFDNRLVAILPGNRLAVFGRAEFKAQAEALKAASGGRFVFKMKVLGQEAKSVADIDRAILGMG